MKKGLFLFGFVLLASVSMNAQDVAKKSCSKKCAKTCEKKASAAVLDSETKVASAIMTAEAAAEADEAIQKRVCPTSGAVSFYQKSVCEHSGNVSWAHVEYCIKTNKFTKVASASMERDAEVMEEAPESAAKATTKKSCAKKCAKTCGSKAKKKA